MNLFEAIRISWVFTCKWHHLKKKNNLQYNHNKKKGTTKIDWNKYNERNTNTHTHTHTKINILYLHVCRISLVWGHYPHDAYKNFNQCHHTNYGHNSKAVTEVVNVIGWPIMSYLGIARESCTIQDHDQTAQDGAEDIQRSVGNSLAWHRRNTTQHSQGGTNPT